MSVALSFVLLVTCACRVHPGANHLLFVSKASSGVDVDLMPAGVEVSAFGRSDTVLGPTFEGGQNVPVIAAFQRGQNLADGWPFVGSVAVTGPAAMAVATGVALSQHAGRADSTGPDPDVLDEISLVRLSEVPNGRDRHRRMFVSGEAPPAWFTTSEGVGVGIELHGPTQPLPESFHAGYRRKESLVVPLSMSEDGSSPNRPVVVHTPAVLNVSRVIPTGDDDRANRCRCHCHRSARSGRGGRKRVQLFATGAAATRLATDEHVQRAILEGFVDTAE